MNNSLLYKRQAIGSATFGTLLLSLFVLGCRGNDFSGDGSTETPRASGAIQAGVEQGGGDPGSGQGGANGGGNGSGGQGQNVQHLPGSGSGAGAGGGIDGQGGGNSGLVDYKGCESLPLGGKRNYPGKCGFNEILVIVNDGATKEMTCCPLKKTDFLAYGPGEVYQEREIKCLPDEVGVGMISNGRSIIFNAGPSRLYCSKINPAALTLGAPTQAQYISAISALSIDLQIIAGKYNANDTCVCPPKSAMIGGHLPKNNQCADQCVELIAK